MESQKLSKDKDKEAKRLLKEQKEKEKEMKKFMKEQKEKEKEALRIKKEEEKESKRLQKEKEDKEKEAIRLKKEEEKEIKRLQKEKEEQEKEALRLKREEEKEAKRLTKEKEEKEKETKRLMKEQKDEEKKREEELEKRKKAKQASFFTSFFIKKVDKSGIEDAPSDVSTVNDADLRGFQKFQIKKDMRLCAIIRRNPLTEEDRRIFDSHVFEGNSICCSYLEELKKGYKRRSVATWTLNEFMSSQDVIVNVSEWRRVKLLQFHENVRPAYYGTWVKTSATVRPRKPYAQDTTTLDYEYDSEGEWEEEEPGENISRSENEEDEEDANDEEDDGFLVPHGYLSEDEVCVEDDDDDKEDAEKRGERQLASQKKFEESMRQKLQPLKPVLHGVLFSEDPIMSEEAAFICFHELPISVSCNEEESLNTSTAKTPRSRKKRASNTCTPNIPDNTAAKRLCPSPMC